MLDPQTLQEMNKAFDEIQMPRTPFAINKMVVGSKFTDEQRYAQCVLELSIAYDNLRIAQQRARIKEIEIEKLENFENALESSLDRETRVCETEIKKIELEQLNRARLGALREFDYLFNLWQSFPTKYTREQLNEASPVEYTKMLETQAEQDLQAMGRVSQGNQEGLRQIGRSIYPQIDAVRDVERRFLSTGKCRLLIVIPTEEKVEKTPPCIESLIIPNGVEFKVLNVFGRKVDDAYNYAVQQALEEHVDFILTVEDDTYPTSDALVRLLDQYRNLVNSGIEKLAIGGWYPKREEVREGVHIELIDGERRAMPDDGSVREAYTLSMGCTLYPIEIFMAPNTAFPWFRTTENLSQDSFFSQLAREAGYKLLVDTSIKCKHIDRVTNKIYE